MLKAFDLGLDTSVNLGAKLFVESVCDEVGVSLALSNKVVGQLVDFGDDGLWDDLEDLLVGVGDCILLKVLDFFFDDFNRLLQVFLLETRGNLLAMVLSAEFVAELIELILLELWKEARGQRIQKFKKRLNLVQWK